MNNLNEFTEYVVKKGDTLFDIARKNNVTVDELKDVNMLTSNNIYPGQILLIPMDVSENDFYFEKYVTKENDTINQIAKKESVDESLLTTFNDISKFKLVENQSMKIPRSKVYVVVEGDTVEKVLRKSGKSCIELMKANESTWIKEGTIIKL